MVGVGSSGSGEGRLRGGRLPGGVGEGEGASPKWVSDDAEEACMLCGTRSVSLRVNGQLFRDFCARIVGVFAVAVVSTERWSVFPSERVACFV